MKKIKADWREAVSEVHAMQRICGEFLEMPGLQLTCGQAQRLFGLSERTCATLLEELVARKFLARHRNGTYGRLSDESIGAVSNLRAGRDHRMGRMA